MRIILRTVAVFLFYSLSACAFNTNMSLDQTALQFEGQTDKRVAVTAFDSRPYVLSEDKTPEWIGMQRSGYGIPFGVHTNSGNPLAQDFSKSVATALQRKGVRATAVNGPRLAKEKNEVLQVVGRKQDDFDRVILIDLNQWRSDTMTNITLDYDIGFSVLDSKMRPLASTKAKNSDKLDGSIWNPVGASEEAVTNAQKKIFDNLLGDPSIVSSLR